MKKRFTILLLFLVSISWGQTPPCLPSAGGELAGDVPPGCKICGPIYVGSTGGYSADNFQLVFPCGAIENNQFIKVNVNSIGTIEVTIEATNCRDSNGIEMILYDLDLNPVSNCFSSEGTNLQGTIIATRLTPGNDYILMIDGYEGDSCDILVNVSGTHPIGPPDGTGPITVIPDVPQFCPGAEAHYSIEPVSGGIEFYEWVVPSNATVIEGGGLQDTFVKVEYNTPGGGTVKVTPSTSCFPLFPAISPVVVAPVIVPPQPPIFFCVNEPPPPECDTTIIFQTSLGCDSLVTYICLPKIQLPNSVRVIACPGQCFMIGDTCVTASGRYEIKREAPKCDSIILLAFDTLSSTIDTIPPPIVNCNIGSDIINFNWRQNSINDGYLIEIQGVVIDTLVNQTAYIYRLSPNDSLIQFRLIPFGSASCPYAIGEVTCDLRTSSTATTFHESGLKIHPNPTNGQVQIESESTIEKVVVFDISGKQILTTKQPNVSLSAQPAGIYFFRIETANGVAVQRMIKN